MTTPHARHTFRKAATSDLGAVSGACGYRNPLVETQLRESPVMMVPRAETVLVLQVLRAALKKEKGRNDTMPKVAYWPVGGASARATC